ncbi:MAG TPA: hypothetical protein VJT49_05195 [Amycolatopsis sp.]|uniref:hypothetical protein n=1 Tax=Amycolatopsis sp. TaxID=37632 RepID=UPI002B499AD9|nr:hypothetical protein [Amycolatopsis sp.]HKS44503.1 hypothetical protein [Amycolatopsis sp.]
MSGLARTGLERDRAVVVAMAEVAEALMRVVSAYGRAGSLEAVGTDILRMYGAGTARLGASMVGRADEIDGAATRAIPSSPAARP